MGIPSPLLLQCAEHHFPIPGTLFPNPHFVFNLLFPWKVSIFSFALFIFSDPINNVLTPQIAFVSLTLFSQLRIPMMVLADLIGQLIQTAVSNRRLKSFMMADEVDPSDIERDPNPECEEE
jgi:hypothetical protein